MSLTCEHVSALLSYNPETGIFVWRVNRSGKAKAGTPAGSKHPDGYISIGVNGKLYLAHRLAWLLMTGHFPPSCVDHINGDPADNRWQNLRAATPSENAQSLAKYRNNSSGFTGVYKRGQRFEAKIRVNGRLHNIGSFSSAEDAHRAYLLAKQDKHNFQPAPRETHDFGTQLTYARIEFGPVVGAAA